MNTDTSTLTGVINKVALNMGRSLAASPCKQSELVELPFLKNVSNMGLKLGLEKLRLWGHVEEYQDGILRVRAAVKAQYSVPVENVF